MRYSFENKNHLLSDQEKWQQGTEKFSEFVAMLNKRSNIGILDSTLRLFFRDRIFSLIDKCTPLDVDPQIYIGPIQAMFLGEKPACFALESCALLYRELSHFDFITLGDYTYSPEQVATVIKNHPEIFSEYNLQTPGEVIRYLNSADREQDGLIRGLILGYPKDSVLNYEKCQLSYGNKEVRLIGRLYELGDEGIKLKLDGVRDGIMDFDSLCEFLKNKFSLHKKFLGLSDSDLKTLDYENVRYSLYNSKVVNIHGVTWVDYDLPNNSPTFKKRLKKAFETSGILGVIKTNN